MSGPKDYEIAFNAERLLRIMATRRRQLAARAAAAEARQAAAREKARRKAIEAQREAERQAAQRAKMVENAAANQARLAAARVRNEELNTARDTSRAHEIEKLHERRAEQAKRIRTSAQLASAFDNSEMHQGQEIPINDQAEAPPVVPERLQELLDAWAEFQRISAQSRSEQPKQLATAIDRVSQTSEYSETWRKQVEHLLNEVQNATRDVHQQITATAEAIGALAGWQEELRADDDVQAFQRQEAEELSAQIVKLVEQDVAGLSPTEAHDRVNSLHSHCQMLFDRAGELRAKFNTRNELLSDVIESLKKIGFFVSDPQYENDANPTGPVIIKATRSGEEMTASIDLSETVRSVWNGIADEKCKSSFFEYVDEMGKKGIEVKPLRNDLRSRPQLRQKGAKSIPGTSDFKKGG